MTNPLPLTVKSFVFDGSSHGDDRQHAGQLKLSTKCYTPRFSSPKDSEGWTLLFAHASGAHKEQWEPIIQKIIEERKDDDGSRIREAWSVDWPNHGEGAIINEQILRNRPEGVSIIEWASTIAHFITTVKFNPRRTIAIGHSAGSSALMLATTHFPTNKTPFAALINVEPTMIPRHIYYKNSEYMEKAISAFNRHTSGRRDVWESREAASKWLGNRPPWNKWDPRVLQLFCEYALRRDVRSNEAEAVTINCNKKHEGAAFAQVESAFAASAQFKAISMSIPVHFIFGAICNVVPKFQREAILDTSQGGRVSSVQLIPGAGHMVIQEYPDSVARALLDVMRDLEPATSTKL